jgi:hypothetical protein
MTASGVSRERRNPLEGIPDVNHRMIIDYQACASISCSQRSGRSGVVESLVLPRRSASRDEASDAVGSR